MDSRDRTILRLAVPALATLAIEPLYVLVDTAIVGHLGTAPLGGLALASTVLTTAFFVVTFLEYGVTARVAFLTGAGDPRGAAGVATQGLWLSAAFGSGLGLIVGLGARALPDALGGSGPVLDAAATYLRISAVGAPLLIVALVGNGFLRGVQDTRTPLVIVAVANVVNVVAEVVLVYGLDLGVAGSAWGTVIAEAVAATWFAAVMARHVRSTGAGPRPERVELRRLLRMGWHLSVRTGSLLGTLALSTAVAARLGAATLGGHQIALQMENLLALMVDGLAIAAQALIGTALGAGDDQEARAVGRRLVSWGVGAGIVLCTVVLAVSHVLPHVFSPDAAVRDRAAVALVLVGTVQLPAAVVFVLDGVLIGASDTAYQQWANVAAFVVFCPFAAAVLRWHGFGIAGVWVGLLAWMVARLVANVARFAGPRWTMVAP